MLRVIRIIQTYLVCAVPAVIACAIWSAARPGDTQPFSSAISKVLWEVLSWNLMAWFAVLVAFLILLMLSPAARETVLKRLANLKERDEREELITGRASRAVYVSTLSILAFLLFVSVFSLRIDHDRLAIDAHFNFLDDHPSSEATKAPAVFDSKSFALSKEAMVLILISWQLVAFNLAARREQRG